MHDALETTSLAFLAEVMSRASSSMKGVDFGTILADLARWSQEPVRALKIRTPGAQHTVSFGLIESDVVLWAAYPRNDDGAKVVVLPRLFRRLPENARVELLNRVSEITPKVRIEGTGLLQLPMHLLTGDRALSGFLDLLALTLDFARKHRRASR